MAEAEKVPTVKDGLATGVQSVGGVPVLIKEGVLKSDTASEKDVDAANEKERVLAAFHLTDSDSATKEVSEGASGKDSAAAEKPLGLAMGVQSVSGVPTLSKQIAELDKPDDAKNAEKEKEKVLMAFHSSDSPNKTAATPRVEGPSATVAETEPNPKERTKGTMAALKDKVALAFKSEPKDQNEDTKEREDSAVDRGEATYVGPTLKDRVYQSVGSFGGKVMSQAASLTRSTSKSEQRDGFEDRDPAAAVTPSAVTPSAVTPTQNAAAAPDLASPGAERASVKELMIQRIGSLSGKMKSAWKPEDKKTGTKEDSKPVMQETTGKQETTPDAPRTSSKIVPDHSYGKGRVMVFSISGCPHCKAAKALLKKKGVRFAEVNLDVFPERRGEMQERTGKSSCPQIFFNDKLIGGNDSLQALENEGKLDAELQLVNKTAVPDTAPAPAGPQKAAATSPALVRPPDEHIRTVKLLREKLPVKDRWFKLRKYERCFVGSEAVDLLVEERSISRQVATSLLQQILTKHFFHHVVREHGFKDGPFFYRFLEHEPFVKTAANWGSATSDTEPPPAVELGNQLRKLILAVYDEFLSDDGRHVDYQGISKSEIFRRYVQLSLQLQRVDVLALSREEKLALFINIYNALVIHVTVVLGYGPTTLAVRRHFFTEHTYVIGGSAYSLTAIENGILRGNQRPPFFFSKPFGEKDDRLPVALTTSEPLIHFALVCGAKSCPPVKTYEPKTVDEALKAAAQGFFEGGGARIDVDAKTIHLSKILSWYKSDFGATDLEVLKFVARFLTLKERDKLEALVSEGKYKIEYQPYDWSANGNE